MTMTAERASVEIAALNDAINKHQELEGYRTRLEVLEAHFAAAMERNEQLETANERIGRQRDENHKDAEFYRLIIKQVQENPSIQSYWDEFLVAMKLVNPEIEQEFTRINRGW